MLLLLRQVSAGGPGVCAIYSNNNKLECWLLLSKLLLSKLLLFECCKDGRLNELIDLLKPYQKNVKKCLVECLFEGIVLKMKKIIFIFYCFFFFNKANGLYLLQH